MTSNLRLRIVSALVMAAVALAVTWMGGLPFRVLAALAGIAMFLEWTQLSGVTANRAHWLACLALLAAPILLLILGIAPLAILVVTGLAFLGALATGLLTGGSRWGGYGLLYGALPAFAMAAIRGDSWPGFAAIIFLFAVVWATDIFAYFVGRAIGGPKLAPAISPGKTWSGAIGGAASGVVAGVATALFFGISPWALALVALLLSIVSQFGDLFESWVKRRFGAKDSSTFIPGHGGVMDRLDGLVAAALALYVVGWLVSGAETPAAGLFGH